MPMLVYKYCKNCGDIIESSNKFFCSHNCYWRYSENQDLIDARFWSHVKIRGRDKCWLYNAHENPTKHANFAYCKNGKKVQVGAHVFSFVLVYGIESLYKNGVKLFVCHTCDNPPCVNFHHLFAGTQEDNIRDMISKCRDNHR